MTTKTCTKCGEGLPLDAFSNEAKRRDGKYPWCKECSSKHRKARYVSVPRKVWIEQKVCSKCKEWKPRDQYNKYKGNNLHYRCIACEERELEFEANGVCDCSSCGEVKPLDEFYKSRQKKKSRQCIACHKEYHRQEDVKLRSRDSRLQRAFGITLVQYQELIDRQGGKCPICLKEFEEGNYSYPVDHAHRGPNAGVIRAILHDRCNRFVMADHTDPEVLRRAADLMESPLTDWFVPEDMVKPVKKRKRRTRPEYLDDMAAKSIANGRKPRKRRSTTPRKVKNEQS